MIAATALDIDGAPSVGATVDVFGDYGFAVTFIFARTSKRMSAFPLSDCRPFVSGSYLDDWHVGGTRKWAMAGAAVLCRKPRTHPVWQRRRLRNRFLARRGGGVKLMASRHIGARLDGRLYAVFVGPEGRRVASATRRLLFRARCFSRLAVASNAGLIVSF